MVLGNAKVKVRIADERKLGLSLHAVAFMQNELELLLVDCRGSQKRRFNAFLEPFRHGILGLGDILKGLFLRVWLALRRAIAERDDALQARPPNTLL